MLPDKWSQLKLPSIGKPDPAEQERLLKLFWNRAELKKELQGLDDQLHNLRNKLKQQENANSRLQQQLEQLEMLLGNPERGFDALVHFGLKALWRACREQLERFAADLKRDRQDAQRKQQLAEFQQDRSERLKVADERLRQAQEVADAERERLRQRDERIDNAHHKAKGEVLYDKRASVQPIRLYRPEHFEFHGDNTATCPAGKTLTSNGSIYTHKSGARVQQYKARGDDCQACALRQRCLNNPTTGKGRNVSLFGRALAGENDPSQKMRKAIDSPRGRALYSRRIATVEPVFANIRHHKGMRRFTLRGKPKVSTQWQLYCLVHNIEKIATKAMRAG